MGSTYIVNVASQLNLRDAPVDGNIITKMDRNTEVDALGESDVEGWWKISVNVGSMIETGYAASRYLVPFDPPPRSRFRFRWLSSIKASIDRVQEFVGEMADALDGDENIIHALNDVVKVYKINRNAKRFTHFMAQISHESAGFSTLEENLNYSGERLWEIFPSHFESKAEAMEFDGQPERIANRVYANRMQNGDEASGDGYRYRGRGFIQLTGRKNYTNIGERIGVDLINDPDILIRDPITALRAAADYWDSCGINRYADDDDLEQVTRKINGGTHGLADRKQRLRLARSIWGGGRVPD